MNFLHNPSHAGRQTYEFKASALSGRRGQPQMIAAYAAISFIWVFFVNYIFELRAFQQLSSWPQLFLPYRSNADALTVTYNGYMTVITVPIYHERYAYLHTLGLVVAATIVIGFGATVGWLVAEEERRHSIWHICIAITLYFVPSCLLHFIYPDMVAERPKFPRRNPSARFLGLGEWPKSRFKIRFFIILTSTDD